LLKIAVLERGISLDDGTSHIKKSLNVQGLLVHLVIDGSDGDEVQLEEIMALFLNVSTEVIDLGCSLSYAKRKHVARDVNDSKVSV
jgi:hypothetical protein